ncbi:MAG: 5-formyltetrahydrofolate cyclo-ligase [bacterium]|nr:5-formyltetrahydrofolate cyclo-ligase [bacterium]
MSAAHSSEEKERLRSALRHDLDSVDQTFALEVGIAIDAFLRVSRAWIEASEVAVFASLSGEVDTQPLIRSATEEGKTILFPRVIGKGMLEFAAVEEGEFLVPGRLGIGEPDSRRTARPLSGATLALVPGLAFDRRGGRLGRGAGYYDRALASARAGREQPLCLGIAFALQVVESVPMTPLDARLDGLVTEEEFILIRSERQ